MKINVKHIAHLANLPLHDGEEEKFERQLSEILNHVKRLDTLNTDTVVQTSQVTGLENVTREDTTEPSLTQEEALSNAPQKNKGMFLVEGILQTE